MICKVIRRNSGIFLLHEVLCFSILLKFLFSTDADTRIRTVDLLITNQLLYQLSYVGAIKSRKEF